MILIVDDETFAIDMMQRKLSAYNLELTGAKTVQDAIHKLETIPEIDLVITDLAMPDATGFDLLAWLNEHRPNVKTIVVTAHRGEIENPLNHPSIHYDRLILKPYSVETELIVAINDLI